MKIKYSVQKTNNKYPDFSYMSWDVYLERSDGFEHCCECPTEEIAKNICKLLNEQLNENKNQDPPN